MGELRDKWPSFRSHEPAAMMNAGGFGADKIYLFSQAQEWKKLSGKTYLTYDLFLTDVTIALGRCVDALSSRLFLNLAQHRIKMPVFVTASRSGFCCCRCWCLVFRGLEKKTEASDARQKVLSQTGVSRFFFYIRTVLRGQWGPQEFNFKENFRI